MLCRWLNEKNKENSIYISCFLRFLFFETTTETINEETSFHDGSKGKCSSYGVPPAISVPINGGNSCRNVSRRGGRRSCPCKIGGSRIRMSGPFAGTIKELCGQRFRKCCRIAAEMDRVSQDSNNCSVNEPETYGWYEWKIGERSNVS